MPETHQTASGNWRASLREVIAELGTSSSNPAERAVELAKQLMDRARVLQTPSEERQQAELERMMQFPDDKTTLMQITDQSFRSERAARSADQLVHLLDIQGIPRFFGPLDRTMLKGFQTFGAHLPGVAMPLVKEKMREETANVILPAEPDHLNRHLDARHKQGVRMNVNFLGEALLGEGEARARLDRYLKALQDPHIEVLSVKISTLYSQIHAIDRATVLEVLGDRLELLYRAAERNRFTRADGTVVPKFVYLDMEEYRDLHLTTDVFLQTLGRPGFEQVQAGIALQAYVPDSWSVQQRITDWARKRIAAGGAPVTIRIVKGANMEMERVEASHHDWPQAPYTRKIDTDANYKRMLAYALQPEHAAAVRIGVASHNLFDLSLGLILATENAVLDSVQFEMLEGMANHQRRALTELDPNMLLYAPATRREDFIHAIGYLVRRLDENTGEDNFLRHTFRLEVGSPEWDQLKQGFLEAWETRHAVRATPRRTQDRRIAPAPAESGNPGFRNEPDTDWSLPHNVEWSDTLRAQWKTQHGEDAASIPLEIGGQLRSGGEKVESFDPSRPGVVVARCTMPIEQDIEDALACGEADPAGWRSLSSEDREARLLGAAEFFRARRGDLLGCAMAECGKLFQETDPEVSEAVDFIEYYVRSARSFRDLETVKVSPLGLVVVVPPWNFPVAIPCGGIAAALAAGNTVIVKPSPDALLCGYKVCQCFWDAGVPKEALQYLPTASVDDASRLVGDPRVKRVVLTGGTETAFAMLENRPDLPLLAETGGKNATIVTAMADRELAVKCVLQSAFGHSGQKCSATSLLILESEVYNDPEFREMLVDGARSLKVGSAWDTATRVNPLVRPPAPKLDRALKELELGEEWALRPERVDHNDCLWSPGIKWGVQPGSFTHLTEFFGPVLGVMQAGDLDEAIDLVHETGFGLTSGLHSLDDREQVHWIARLKAGNLYVNRTTTGAIVERQPFGGMKQSAFGAGIKAGGPNYVGQFFAFENRAGEPGGSRGAEPAHADPVLAPVLGLISEGVQQGILSAETAGAATTFLSKLAEGWQREWGQEHDPALLVGQDNRFRYLPAENVRVRVHETTSSFDVLATVGMAIRSGGRCVFSIQEEGNGPVVGFLEQCSRAWGGSVEFLHESEDQVAEAVGTGACARLWVLAGSSAISERLWESVAQSGATLQSGMVLPEPRLGMGFFLQEQSVTVDYHRYGNLGPRTQEVRKPVL